MRNGRFECLDNDQLDAHLIYFTVRPQQSSTCFEHYMLIIRRLNSIHAASVIVLSASGRPVHRLRENNAAIWYNKACRIKHLTPPHVNIRVNGNNPRCQRTKNRAIRYRINQKLKFQYSKEFSLHLCTGRPLTEDDTRCCMNTIQPPDNEHVMLETCRGS